MNIYTNVQLNPLLIGQIFSEFFTFCSELFNGLIPFQSLKTPQGRRRQPHKQPQLLLLCCFHPTGSHKAELYPNSCAPPWDMTAQRVKSSQGALTAQALWLCHCPCTLWPHTHSTVAQQPSGASSHNNQSSCSAGQTFCLSLLPSASHFTIHKSKVNNGH